MGYDVEKYGSIYTTETERLVPIVYFQHEVDDRNCDFCAGMIGQYEGAYWVTGSDEHLSVAGPWHSGCRYWETYDFLPIEDAKPARGLAAVAGALIGLFANCVRSLWPLKVWEDEMPKVAYTYEPVSFYYNEADIEEAKDRIRKHLKDGRPIQWIRDKLYGLFGELIAEVAIGDMGL